MLTGIDTVCLRCSLYLWSVGCKRGMPPCRWECFRQSSDVKVASDAQGSIPRTRQLQGGWAFHFVLTRRQELVRCHVGPVAPLLDRTSFHVCDKQDQRDRSQPCSHLHLETLGAETVKVETPRGGHRQRLGSLKRSRYFPETAPVPHRYPQVRPLGDLALQSSDRFHFRLHCG